MMSAVIQTLEDHNSSIAKHKDINSNHITTLIQPSPIKRNVSIIIENDVYIVEAPGVERIATRINYEDWMARMQLYKHMKKTGVVQALEEAGIAAGDTVRLGNVEWEWD
jgi:Obg family GTPase CgtA-like protein